jgi:hypothetical protein
MPGFGAPESARTAGEGGHSGERTTSLGKPWRRWAGMRRRMDGGDKACLGLSERGCAEAMSPAD